MNPYDVIAPYYNLEHCALTGDIQMYRQFASRQSGDVLVVGAGTGRVAIALAAPHRAIWGIDSSVGMLDIARRARATGITWVAADMTTLDLGRTFDLVIVPLDTFTSLQSPEQQYAALRVMARHLAGNGLVVIDLVNPAALPSPADAGIVRQRYRGPFAGGTLTISDSVEVDLAAQKMHMHLTYDLSTESGIARQCANLTVRWFHRFELEHLCTLSGLIVTQVYGSYDLDPYEDSSPRMIFVAESAR